MAKTQPAALTVSLEPAPSTEGTATLMHRAQAIQIVDKGTHETFRGLIKEAKGFKRDAVEYYAKAKKPLNEARNVLLDMERKTIEPLDRFIAWAEKQDTAYVTEQRRLEQAESDRMRQEAEAAERARRDQEAVKAEVMAATLEASSNVLSEREQNFVGKVVMGNRSIPALIAAAKFAGFKNPEKAVSRLMKSDKINQAIANADSAAAIRREAEARKSAPITVEVAQVETQIGKVPGTSVRVSYSCRKFDTQAVLKKLATEYGTNMELTALVDQHLGDQAKDQHGDPFSPLQALLSDQARSLKGLFPKSWPMCELVKREGVTG